MCAKSVSSVCYTSIMMWYILLWYYLYRLIQQNYDVVCYLADVGQNEHFEKAKLKALSIGAKDVSSHDHSH